MSFLDLCEKERKLLTDQKPIRWWIIAILWVCGFVSGAVLVSGCGHTAREAGLGVLRTTSAAMKDTGRILTNGANAFGQVQGVPNGQPDSMQLDHELSIDQVRQLAAQYGVKIK